MATITQFYLEKCRTKLSATISKEASDYQLSKLLDVASSTMTRYTKHDGEADDEVAFRMANYLKIPPMEIIGAINAEKAKSDEVRDFWKKAKNATVAGVATVSLCAGLVQSPTVQASDKSFSMYEQSIHYAKFIFFIR
ncbi:hypothetical protein CYQ88_10880 [Hydrogenovibrio sp. SC-1]|uniref:hypothetical protein n=1 Tax=Hydrogenovibrio sp. SC-1 TaxID=2065820 RepID=UPI000C7ABB0F|nr:hypothetical protein [Hydrogenovibrio sp. SC-1]PLA73519.1 hypothetical protein CYQ88_10880 [Hydrogenovibrio sp. SC-1]